ncbi:uncharacterized protein TRIADDRAFT_56080 [Trichoplax adhaerens]|uniref:Uncharacterized protein n=1 Tax=Trichoplax adhaerens TaxID=10228 RepID=B3RTX6_TRIAD|nr:predicted protein [Trichoplax adhaerens]EDV26212.1 predicted protein [Trichoplax adhaerens]|eukprot:XP_002112245.1 predicted protein [Trichoplax adhaerens]
MMSWKTFVPPQLRNSSIKLEDKIAWIKTALWHPNNSTLFIPNKFQVVCDWVVDQLITISRRSQDRGAATQMLWELFDSILPTMSNHGTVKALILQALAERMLQVIKADNHQNTGFQDEIKILLSCCGSLFNKQANLNIDIANLNIEGLATFLASFIALWIVSTKNENSFSETILNLLLCIIQYTNRMLSQQSNQKKVFVVYCELLLANNIVLRYSLRQLLTSQMPYNTKLLENVLNAVERLLAGILFHREMKKIVTSAEFNFYVELVKLIQLEKMFDQNQTIRQNTASAFNALTDIVIKFDIYQPSVDSVAGNTQLTWMKNRCEDLVGRSLFYDDSH